MVLNGDLVDWAHDQLSLGYRGNLSSFVLGWFWSILFVSRQKHRFSPLAMYEIRVVHYKIMEF